MEFLSLSRRCSSTWNVPASKSPEKWMFSQAMVMLTKTGFAFIFFWTTQPLEPTGLKYRKWCHGNMAFSQVNYNLTLRLCTKRTNYLSAMILINNHVTVEPSYNEPLDNKVLGITNDFLYPNYCKIYYMQKFLGIMKPHRSKQILPTPLHFVILRFCNGQNGFITIITQWQHDKQLIRDD